MDFKEKIETICAKKNLNQKQFAEHLNLNHIVFNRNLRGNKITPDFIESIIKFMPEIDLNWLLKEPSVNEVNEPASEYKKYRNPQEKIKEAISILTELSNDLLQK